MPAFWISSYDDVTGEVVLSDGRTFNVNDIPGNGWPQNRLNALRDKLLEQSDVRQLISDLPDEDPDKTATPAELSAQYGGRVFIDDPPGPSGPFLVSRSVDYTVTWDGTRHHFSVFTVN